MHLKNLICSLFFSLALGLFALSTPTERIDLAERAPLSIVQITNNLLATVQQIKAGIKVPPPTDPTPVVQAILSAYANATVSLSQIQQASASDQQQVQQISLTVATALNATFATFALWPAQVIGPVITQHGGDPTIAHFCSILGALLRFLLWLLWQLIKWLFSSLVSDGFNQTVTLLENAPAPPS